MRHIPPAYTRVAHNETLGIEVFRDFAHDVTVMGFAGKRQNPDFHFRFRSEKAATEYVDNWIKGIKAHAERVAERKEKRKAGHTLKVGDLLVASWGYEQTNVDYYQVVKLVGTTMVEVQEIAQSIREEGWMRGRTTPVPDNFVGKPTKHRVGEGNTIKVRDWGVWAHPCTAEDTRYWSSYA